MTINTLRINVWSDCPEHQKLVDIFMRRIKEECKAENRTRTNTDMKVMSPVKQQEICIPDHEYDKWVSQISKLKPKKQKQWKEKLWDKWGCKTKVRYEDGEFWNYCAAGSRGSEGGHRAMVLPQTRMVKNAIKDGHEVRTGSLIGAASMVATKMKMEAETCMKKDDHKLYTKIIDEIFHDINMSVTKDNKTGNHYRNHTIKAEGNLYGHH